MAKNPTTFKCGECGKRRSMNHMAIGKYAGQFNDEAICTFCIS